MVVLVGQVLFGCARFVGDSLLEDVEDAVFGSFEGCLIFEAHVASDQVEMGRVDQQVSTVSVRLFSRGLSGFDRHKLAFGHLPGLLEDVWPVLLERVQDFSLHFRHLLDLN